MLPACVAAVGSDRYLHEAEVVAACGPSPALGEAWALYQDFFDGFCETGLDPMGHRFRHPASSTGQILLDPDETVLIVGTGPSLARALPALERVRGRVRVFTSPRGAERLAAAGLVPDLVLVEHRTALDAHHSARHRRDGSEDVLARVPLVAADWRTPAPLVAGVADHRLFVPAPLPTWGAWPATLAAMACGAGARRIGLLGIDLGTARYPDPAFAPLVQLLGLLARATQTSAGTAGPVTLDCGQGGAAKPGWSAAPVEQLAGRPMREPLAVDRRAAPTPAARVAEALAAREHLAPVVEFARDVLGSALAVRGGQGRADALPRAAEMLLGWGHEPEVRIGLQETLGVTFLPRLWRQGLDTTLGPALWRPLVLAAHEIVGQASRLDAWREEAVA